MSNKPGFFRQLKDTQNYSTKFLIVLFSPNSGVTPFTNENHFPTVKTIETTLAKILDKLAKFSKLNFLGLVCSLDELLERLFSKSWLIFLPCLFNLI